jgi:LacI family transcriptional regulator
MRLRIATPEVRSSLLVWDPASTQGTEATHARGSGVTDRVGCRWAERAAPGFSQAASARVLFLVADGIMLNAMVSSKDVAEISGLSQATVSRVFRKNTSVRPETRERVMEAARALGYLPNPAARSLVTRKTNTIGLVVADLANAYYPRIIDAMHTELASRGFRMALIRDRQADGVPDDSGILAEASVDGAVFMSAWHGSKTVADFVATGRPAVQTSRYDPQVPTDLILADETAAARLVVEHLAGLGHRRIALLAGSQDAASSVDRANAFRRAMKDAGLPLPEDYVRHVPIQHQAGCAAADELLAQDPRPTAIYGAADTLAIAAMDSATRNGLKIPQDISVVGFDDTEPSAWAMVNLTTVHQPLGEMARRAVGLLIDRLSRVREVPPEKIVFPVSLVVRGTTAPPR